MPTQEEVFEAINRLGCATYSELKKIFNMQQLRGNSNLPQRIKALEKRGLIAVFRFKGKTLILPAELEYTLEEIQEFLDEIGYELKTKGRPEGLVEYRDESITKLLNFIREKKIVTIRHIQREMGWNWKTTKKYIDKLINDGIIFEYRLNGIRCFTTSII